MMEPGASIFFWSLVGGKRDTMKVGKVKSYHATIRTFKGLKGPCVITEENELVFVENIVTLTSEVNHALRPLVERVVNTGNKQSRDVKNYS